MKVNCANPACGKEIERTPSEIARRKNQFCDKECHDDYQRARHPRTIVNCANPGCGRELERTPSKVARYKHQFCSPECSAVFQTGRKASPETLAKKSAAMKEHFADPAERAKISTAVRERYTDPAERSKTSAAIKKAMAAPELRARMRKIYDDPEHRAKLSAAAVERCADPAERSRRSNAASKQVANNRKSRSKIEPIVEAFLVELGLVKGVDFFTNKHFHSKDPDYVDGRFGMNVDFWIPALNLVIECNGTYWHLDPRIYDRSGNTPMLKSMNATQREDVRRYERKVRWLRSRGIRVLELWEQENPLAELIVVWPVIAELAVAECGLEDLETLLMPSGAA